MKQLNWIDWVAIVLLIIGGLNWGILGLFKTNVIETIFGDMTVVTRIIYVLVGLAAIHLGIIAMNLVKREE